MARNFRSTIFSIILLCLLRVEKTFAQSSNVTCLPSYSWASNSKSQNPCIVAAILQTVCNDGVFTVNSLPDGYHYIGPRQNDPSTQNVCICSTPVYELMSACADCQNRTFISWSAWSLYCTNFPGIQEGIYNSSIPRSTAIPQWAFEKPSQNNDLYNSTLAKQIGDSPESTFVPSSTEFSSSTLAGTTTGTPTLSTSFSLPFTVSTSTPAGSGGGSKTNVAAIAGGVGGGVVGIALIAGLAYLLLRNRGPPEARPDPNAYQGTLNNTTDTTFNGDPAFNGAPTYNQRAPGFITPPMQGLNEGPIFPGPNQGVTIPMREPYTNLGVMGFVPPPVQEQPQLAHQQPQMAPLYTGGDRPMSLNTAQNSPSYTGDVQSFPPTESTGQYPDPNYSVGHGAYPHSPQAEHQPQFPRPGGYNYVPEV